MKFLDLNTGYTFDGLWKDDQEKGYIFWFPNEQSTNITYILPICIIDTNINDMTLSIEDNDVFSFITHDNTESVDGYIFNSPIYSKTLDVNSVDCENAGDKRAFVFYVAASSKVDGEYVCKIKIGDKGYIRVGADFYGENESIYVNLSNMGVEIPDTVQKAIYDSNVHEDFKDNILLNRKFKELLSNYWDIIANRGSYKSLKNSLDWFEWGNELNIREIWKRDEAGFSIFDERDILSIFEEKIYESFENSIKTTYLSLYYNRFIDGDDYDEEYNPTLKETIMKWSKEDLQLKMSLLAQFFGTFFLPIHMSLLHATVEDIVYTNTIKAIHAASYNRNDSFEDFTLVNTNIKHNDVFRIHNVRAQVTDNTVYGVKDNMSQVSFGVDELGNLDSVSNHDAFNNQYYVGPGVIIPIEIEIPEQAFGDFIKQTIVDFTDKHNHETRLNFYNKIYSKNGKFIIKFNFLAKEVMKYNIRMCFITGSSKTISHNFNFTVEDADNLVINVYKVKAKDDSGEGFTLTDFLDRSINEYFFKVTKNNTKYYTQYLPYMSKDNPLYSKYDGIKLSRTVIFDVQNVRGTGIKLSDYQILIIQGLMDDDFIEFIKYDENNKIKFLIYVSKHFYGDIPNEIYTNYNNLYKNIIRNDLGFYPQFHTLKLMTGNKIENYTVSQYEAVCCAAEINHGRNNERFRYGHIIEDAEWSFYNPATLETIEHPTSVRVPFVADKKLLNPGYYDIIFKYSLANGVKNECKRESAFRIKTI